MRAIARILSCAGRSVRRIVTGPAPARQQVSRPEGQAMGWVALKMLVGDKAKYFALIFAIAFGSMLMAHQTSIFCGLMLRTASVIRDIPRRDFCVTDPNLQNAD